MPTPTNYPYALSAFPAGLNEDRFHKEIITSSIVTALDGITTLGSDVSVAFKDALSGTDEATLTALVAAHSGQPLPHPVSSSGAPLVELAQRQGDGTPRFVLGERMGSEVIYGSHDFCDPTTWFMESVRVNAKALTDTAGVWSTGDVNVIDIFGRVFDDDAYVKDQIDANPGDAHGYQFVLTVDGVAKTRRDPFETSGGDYVLNAAAGTVTPTSGSWTGQAVVASYSKATTSGFSLVPDAGSTLTIEGGKVQVSADIELRDTIQFEIFGQAQFFAPDAVAAAYLQATDLVPLATPTHYKTIDQMIDEVDDLNECFTSGFAGSRGFTQARRVFKFRYGTVRTLYSSLGMQIRFSMKNNVAAGGERATGTFSCLAKADPGYAAALATLMG